MATLDTADPQAVFRDDAGTLAIALSGAWSAEHAPRIEELIEEIGGRLEKAGAARIDLSSVVRLDTLGAYVLNRLKAQREEAGGAVEIASQRKEHAVLLAEIQIHGEDAVSDRKSVV